MIRSIGSVNRYTNDDCNNQLPPPPPQAATEYEARLSARRDSTIKEGTYFLKMMGAILSPMAADNLYGGATVLEMLQKIRKHAVPFYRFAHPISTCSICNNALAIAAHVSRLVSII
jgi:hypothetical protein